MTILKAEVALRCTVALRLLVVVRLGIVVWTILTRLRGVPIIARVRCVCTDIPPLSPIPCTVDSIRFVRVRIVGLFLLGSLLSVG